jgi:hypothetical protein
MRPAPWLLVPALALAACQSDPDTGGIPPAADG